MPKIMCVVGARPNFMKIAPIMKALKRNSSLVSTMLVHTGQHYDIAMNQRFFEQLEIPKPDVNLEVGSSSHAVQTAEIMRKFEPVLDHTQPAAILVVGDVNSTIACALVASKKQVAVIHVEAGLRSFDRTMPEEINRVLTDQISDLLFTTERNAQHNLVREGIDEGRIVFVGNVMIDTLCASLEKAVPARETVAAAARDPALFLNSSNGFGLLTLHRPANVDDGAILIRLLTVLREISDALPLIFPVHPRTDSAIEKHGLRDVLNTPRILVLPPQGYLELLGLMAKTRLVLTDSGGIQEETTALGIPCITLRESTERPITVDEGTNTIVGSDPERIRLVFREILETGGKAGHIPVFWDGHAAERIVDHILVWLRCSERM